jgi:predicted nucleotidyltransferase
VVILVILGRGSTPRRPAVKRPSETLLRRIVERLVDSVHPARVYLFGSQATGRADRPSDIDLLLVVPDTATAPRDWARRGRRSLWGMGVPVDLVVCTTSEMDEWADVPCNLIHSAVQSGRLLYVSQG